MSGGSKDEGGGGLIVVDGEKIAVLELMHYRPATTFIMRKNIISMC